MGRGRAAERPAGLVYEPDFLDSREEAEIVALVEGLSFREVRIRGQAARRTVVHFGFDYDYEGRRLIPTEPLPKQLAGLRDRCAAVVEVEPQRLAQTLVARYPAGATIGWHRDAPMFGDVVGVSLLASCRMRFRRGSGEEREVFELELQPRSAYVLAGAARSIWQHSIPPAKSLRYSITFRTLRNPQRWT